MGINTIRKVPSLIAKFLGKDEPERYTRTLFGVLRPAHGDWKSAEVAERYVGKSKKQKRDNAAALLGVLLTKESDVPTHSKTST